MTEKTLVLIKPDGVEKNLTGEIIRRFENAKLKITAMKMLNANIETVSKHYPEDEDYLIELGKKSQKAGGEIPNLREHGMMIVKSLRQYITRGPIVAMIIEGPNAISSVREINGYTDPSKAEKGTIRGDYGDDNILEANAAKRPVRNLVHASGNKEEAETEINLWFKPEELYDYSNSNN